MKLSRVYIRYFPPGLTLEWKNLAGQITHEEIDLLQVKGEEDAGSFTSNFISTREDLQHHRRHLEKVIKRLIEKVHSSKVNEIYLEKCLRAHCLPLTKTALNKDGNVCVTGSYDRTARIWALKTGAPLGTLTGHEDAIYDVTFLGRHDQLIATGGLDSTIRIWPFKEAWLSDAKTETTSIKNFDDYNEPIVSEVLLTDHSGPITAVKNYFLNGNTYLLSGSIDETIRIWDIEMGECIGVLKGHTATISSIGHARSSSFIYSTSFDGTTALWDPRSHKCTSTFSVNDCLINEGALSWSDLLVGTAATDASAYLWDVRWSSQPLTTIQHDAEVNSVCMNNRGSMMVTASLDGSSHVICLASFKRKCSLQAHLGEVTTAKFDANGNRIFTGGDDGKLIMWNSETGDILQVCGKHNSAIYSMNISYDGLGIVTAGSDALCCYWTTIMK